MKGTVEERCRVMEDTKIRNKVFGRKSQCLWKKGKERGVILSVVYNL